MSAFDRLVELRDSLSVVLVDKIAITPAEPPATDECSALYVWAARIFHSPAGVVTGGDEAGCFYRRSYELRYRLDVCYPPRDDGREYSAVEYQAKSEEIYQLADDAWCAVSADANDGLLFLGVDCEDVVIREITIDAQGDRVSAEGSVLLTDPCPVGS
jgi:hypothetical protein